jgi:acetoacetyl-CoA synthetase
MDVDIFDHEGKSIINIEGELVCKKPFPSMPIKFWNDPNDKKYKEAYFSYFKGAWRHGDWAKITDRGTIKIYGRSDATLNPGGIRIGTAEIYGQVEHFDEINECLVIGQNWENDTRIILFTKLQDGYDFTETLQNKIRSTIKANLSPRHVPAKIISVLDIPKTRSGKITELAVRDLVHNVEIKNREALANPESLEHFKNLKVLTED